MTDQSEPILTVADILAAPPWSPWMEAHARAAGQEATGRARLEWVAGLFDASRLIRHRFDPRRLSDRFVARACRGWITRSERAGAAAQAKREATP